MQSLGEILNYHDPQYVKYLSRKTQYLITQDRHDFVHKFWQHLIVEYHPLHTVPHLPLTQQKHFFQLLKSFGHDKRSSMQKKYALLEKKIPWILQHPDGGYFIPYEIIKTLMPSNRAIPVGFLFQLIYAMPVKEQHALRSLLARSHRSRDALTLEKHPLDRALAIYIWIAGHRHLKLPHTKPHTLAIGIRSIWSHLQEKFPKMKSEISEWQHLMQTGQKGFYRSLSLIRGAELMKTYIASLTIVPIAARRHKFFPASGLRYSIPLEFMPEKIVPKFR